MSWSAWIPVTAVLAVLFVVDWRRFGRLDGPVPAARAARWSVLWLLVGLGFTAVVWASSGRGLAGQYLGGYLVERILSVDNLAVLYIVLSGSRAPLRAQSRALSFGLVGALGLRAVLVIAGVALLQVVPGLAAVLGVVLILTGASLMRRHELAGGGGVGGRLARWPGRIIPSTEDFSGRALVVRRDGRLIATPLIALAVAVMAADVVFAVDSVPAVLSFSRVTWVVLAANGFALLGLRPLYFLIAGLVGRLRYLKHGLGIILWIAGLRLIADEFVSVPTWAELGLVVIVLAVATAASLLPARGRTQATSRG